MAIIAIEAKLRVKELEGEADRLRAWNSELADACDDLRAEIARLRSRCDQLRAALVEPLAQLEHYKRIRGLNRAAFCDTPAEYQAELREKARAALSKDWKDPVAEKIAEGLDLCHDEIERSLAEAAPQEGWAAREIRKAKEADERRHTLDRKWNEMEADEGEGKHD